ncbi:MAG TPA: hypothetical protein VNO33_12595, partial [Kofleriaceae bacterium]|nr:hypothetical protein [Kofleriaceae bacterium]
LGERAEAVRRYKLYLDRVPDANNRAEVEAKVSRLEAEIKAETESKKKAAPPPLVPPPVGPSGPDVAPPAPAPTGDPELDRAARIDVKRLRAKRQAAGEGPPPAAQGRAGAPPSEPPPSRPPPAKDTGEKKSKPIYKQWWFWVVAGVSAIIIVSIATSDSDPDDGRARILPFGDAKSDMAQPGGAVLLRF